MRHHHTGSGRRTAIPEDWGSNLTTVTDQFMLEATVSLRKPGGTTTWDDNLGRTVFTPYPPFVLSTPASIQPMSAGGATQVVDQKVFVLGYRVAVPRDTAPTPTQMDEGVEIVVLTCSDPMLVGVTMRVNDVLRGVHRMQRILYADINS